MALQLQEQRLWGPKIAGTTPAEPLHSCKPWSSRERRAGREGAEQEGDLDLGGGGRGMGEVLPWPRAYRAVAAFQGGSQSPVAARRLLGDEAGIHAICLSWNEFSFDD